MIYVLIPIFNEAENIPTLYRELTTVLKEEDTYYVFSDDGSKDNSRDVIQKYFHDKKHIILGGTINKGPGHAFNTGFEWILQHSTTDTDIIITLEADNTSDASLLPKMLMIQRTGFELVLASVYAQGGGFDKTTLWRRILSFWANIIFRFMFDVKVLTLSSFYRIYSLSLLRRIKQRYGIIIEETGFISMLEILLKAIYSQATIIEVPMRLYSAKRKGKSKMKKMKTLLEYLRFLIKFKFHRH